MLPYTRSRIDLLTSLIMMGAGRLFLEVRIWQVSMSVGLILYSLQAFLNPKASLAFISSGRRRRVRDSVIESFSWLFSSLSRFLLPYTRSRIDLLTSLIMMGAGRLFLEVRIWQVSMSVGLILYSIFSLELSLLKQTSQNQHRFSELDYFWFHEEPGSFCGYTAPSHRRLSPFSV